MTWKVQLNKKLFHQFSKINLHFSILPLSIDLSQSILPRTTKQPEQQQGPIEKEGEEEDGSQMLEEPDSSRDNSLIIDESVDSEKQ